MHSGSLLVDIRPRDDTHQSHPRLTVNPRRTEQDGRVVQAEALKRSCHQPMNDPAGWNASGRWNRPFPVPAGPTDVAHRATPRAR